MTFKKGFYLGLVLGGIGVIAGVLYVNRVSEVIENVELLNLADLELQDLAGKEINISDYGGNKNLLVNFWATWCKPCLEEFPLLDEMKRKAGDDFEFIVISDESIEKIKHFADKENYNFIYLKSEELVPHGINFRPQTFILNKDLEKKKYYPGAFEGDPNIMADSLRIWVNK